MNEVKSQEQLTWKVVKHQDKYFCVVLYKRARFCFKYAYDTRDFASCILEKLQSDFGKSINEYQDLAANYLEYHPRINYQFSKSRVTDQRSNYVFVTYA